MTDSMILLQTNNPSEPMTCFVLDWTPTVHGAMLICGSGTCDRAAVTYTYIEYSLYVPLLFLWEGGSQRDGAIPVPFPVAVNERSGPFAEQEAVKRLELLACSSKHPLLVWGPSKGQYTVTSQKLDSWLAAPRSRGREEGHSAASHVLFVTFI